MSRINGVEEKKPGIKKSQWAREQEKLKERIEEYKMRCLYGHRQVSEEQPCAYL
jgi:hypothetical protein